MRTPSLYQRETGLEIKRGDRGYEVVDIQQRLLALGYDLGPNQADGFFGPFTEEAIRKFQEDRRLPVSGLINEDAWRLMVDATYKFGSRALYLRSPFFRGDDVRQLQLWLNSIGFRTEPMDGIFGPSTEKAVREFQENVGVTPDGIVGPSTLAALNNLRGMLDMSQETVFSHLLMPDSVVSLLQDRKIAIGSPTPHKSDWLASTGNQQLICADLAHRLSNLLEILGAQIHFFRLEPSPKIDGELAITFEPGAGAIDPDCLGVAYDQGDESCRLLADSIIAELTTSMKKEVKEVVTGSRPGLGVPAAAIRLGDLQAVISGGNIKKDVVKQKIAGAIFDGLRSFMAARS